MTSPTVLLAKPECEIRVHLADTIEVGNTVAGYRRFTPIVGGTLQGLPGTALEELDARILAGGGDRQRIRTDGTIDINAQYEAVNSQGELLLICARGIRSTRPTDTYFRVNVTFEGAAAEYAQLGGALWIADGVRTKDWVTHTVYRVQ